MLIKCFGTCQPELHCFSIFTRFLDTKVPLQSIWVVTSKRTMYVVGEGMQELAG